MLLFALFAFGVREKDDVFDRFSSLYRYFTYRTGFCWNCLKNDVENRRKLSMGLTWVELSPRVFARFSTKHRYLSTGFAPWVLGLEKNTWFLLLFFGPREHAKNTVFFLNPKPHMAFSSKQYVIFCKNVAKTRESRLGLIFSAHSTSKNAVFKIVLLGSGMNPEPPGLNPKTFLAMGFINPMTLSSMGLMTPIDTRSTISQPPEGIST